MLGLSTKMSIANNPVDHSGIIGGQIINDTIQKVVPKALEAGKEDKYLYNNMVLTVKYKP